MLIRNLEQFVACVCAGCSSNVPYCSSPRSSSALLLLCQLLKSDKLSIFSIASQKATNSLATKLLISTVSSPCLTVGSQCPTDTQRQFGSRAALKPLKTHLFTSSRQKHSVWGQSWFYSGCRPTISCSAQHCMKASLRYKASPPC